MKPFYSFQLKQNLQKITFAFAMVVLSSFISDAFAQKAFTKRTIGNYSPSNGSYRIKGDFTMIGNTNLTLNTYSDNATNDAQMRYVDVDGDNTTFNSSTANLGFSSENGANPACSKVLFAGLYWCGRSNTGSQPSNTFTVTKGGVTKTFDKTKVSLKGPAASGYTTISATTSNILYPNNQYGNIFVGFADVTEYVKTNGAGNYAVADIALREGTSDATGFHGGWSLVVVYENTLMKWRDVTLYDGYAYQSGDGNNNGTNVSYSTLPITGFQAVPTGAVNVKVGMMASEGERGWRRDVLQIDDAATGTNWTTLRFDPSSNTVNDYNDFFTGSIQTGGNTRNPNLRNNTGLDILMFNLPNTNNSLIANNQTSTQFRIGTGADTYVLFNLAFSVDAYVPEVQNVLAVAGSAVTTAIPGQSIEYSIDIFNKGTEAVNNYKMVIPIPAFAEFDGGLTKTLNYTSPTPSPNNLYFDPLLGPTGSVVYDFGTLPLPSAVSPAKVAADALANFKFKLKVTTNCAILRNTQCPPAVSLNGTSGGTGATSGTTFNNVPFITGNGSGTCGSTPSTDPLNITVDASSYQTCGQPGEYDNMNRRVFNACPASPSTTVDVSIATSSFPANTRFFASASLSSEEYTASNPFPAVLGNAMYYALPPGYGACFVPFVINSCNIPQTLSGNVWIDKNGDRIKNGSEDLPPTNMYRIMAVATNGPNAGKAAATAPYNGSGIFTMNVPANPVIDGGSAVAPQFNLVLIRSELDPGVGAEVSIPADGMMGTAPATGGEFYVTNPNDGGVNAGVFNAAGIYENITITTPSVTINNLNIGIQSRPISDPVFTALPSRPVGTFWQLDNDDQVMSGNDAEDGVLETGLGKTFRLLSNPTVQSGLTIKVAYDANGNGPDAADILDASADPDDNIFVDIPNYDKNKLYVFFQSGLGAYTGSFTYSALDAASATSTAPAQYSFTAILPINGLELSGSYSNSKGNLRWTIMTIEDADHFILERSATSSNFKQVTVTPARGKEYNFADDLHSFVGNDAYYRVKMVRKNGTVSYSNIISLKLAGINGLQLMPTAVRSDLQVRFNNPKQQTVNIRVINMNGQVVMNNIQQAAAGNISINLSGFERMAVGTYSVQVFAGNTVHQGKIIVQH